MIPVVDIFAGPGGLGEGFASLDVAGKRVFDVRLSIEKDPSAHETLRLRSFFRQFESGLAPGDYYRRLRGELTTAELLARYPEAAKHAQQRAWCAELGSETVARRVIRRRIESATGGDDTWILLGGPPCQAYSIVGRSRNKGNENYSTDDDARAGLYVEYLQALADHWPAAFVFENVKGLLSFTVGDHRIFLKMLDDLEDPAKAVRGVGRGLRRTGREHRYRISSLVCRRLIESEIPDFVIEAEKYGVPQTRHRVILVGLRDDLGDVRPATLEQSEPVPACDVLDDLPAVRAGLSRKKDSADAWRKEIGDAIYRRWLMGAKRKGGLELRDFITELLHDVPVPEHGRGGEFVEGLPAPRYRPEWFVDDRLGGFCNHATRAHMVSDLHRYLYAASYASVQGESPRLKDFPPDLLPDHSNVAQAISDRHFSDRFRVQIAHAPATTVTSHIAKDGHYYIHPDPAQCRSLTVREAARLQTFPDNYFFAGSRTAQYVQVGNAVPPLLARQIARVVFDALQ